ncbi:hypothetical protein B0H65DRAFT_545648 [Neurospora tetraspora]|uniref:Uncharacterized protein n=1 Tax=Neurospora tetraspora TaxID=94610 RepID=A0AAE0MU27_9PEZI|nr:hypothetical protein B0H65DRAFT_545648 [Neurospora tetraspora]
MAQRLWSSLLFTILSIRSSFLFTILFIRSVPLICSIEASATTITAASHNPLTENPRGSVRLLTVAQRTKLYDEGQANARRHDKLRKRSEREEK